MQAELSTHGWPHVLTWCHSPPEPWHHSWTMGTSQISTREGPWGTGQGKVLLSAPCFLGCSTACAEDPSSVTSSVPAGPTPGPVGGAGSRRRGHWGATATPRQLVAPRQVSEQGTAILSVVPSATTLVLRSRGKMTTFWCFRATFGGLGSCLAEAIAPPAQGADTALMPSERQALPAMWRTPGNGDGDTSCT